VRSSIAEFFSDSSMRVPCIQKNTPQTDQKGVYGGETKEMAEKISSASARRASWPFLRALRA